MIDLDKDQRINAIVEGASELPIENQEYILATIRGMLFTKSHLAKVFERNKNSIIDELLCSEDNNS
jgi:hypothetical protein